MREPYGEKWMSTYKTGFDAYVKGDWTKAKKYLEEIL